MPRHRLEVTAWTGADVNRAWAVATDVATWCEWGPWDRSVIERGPACADSPAGIVFTLHEGTARPYRMEVVEAAPPSTLVLELWSGAPVYAWREEIHLVTLLSGGTNVCVSLDADVEATAATRLTRDALGQHLAEALHRFIRYAEQPDEVNLDLPYGSSQQVPAPH